jgi:hypothetical protein
MLTLRGGQVEVLWDEVLPIEARELPEDLAGLDRVLRDPALLGPVHEAWGRVRRAIVAGRRSPSTCSCG